MFPYFLLGVALLIGILLLSRWYVSTSPKTLVKALKWVGFGAVALVLAWLALTGKLWAAVAALPAMLMWFLRMFTGLRYAQMLARLFGWSGSWGRGRGWSSPGAGGAPGAGRGSDVHTRFVRMHLDHASGHVSGEVLEGAFAGRTLETLSIEELLQLWREAQVDPDSARVVESYLDRRDPNWRTARQDEPRQSANASNMDRAEALRVLGLKAGASVAEIKAAHRRLMAQVHPDHGGSDYLAQQINRAKDVLLEG